MAVGVVRYGAMGKSGVFSVPEGDVAAGSNVVVRTKRGVEWGWLLHVKPDEGGGEKVAGEVLRRATPADHEKQAGLVEKRQAEEFEYCARLIKQYNLPMKLRIVEHLFGDDKIIYYFLSDGRVDFRGLVRDLAKQYRTRIEMRQIGVRDEARMLGLVGPCGHELCCRRFLAALKPVPMKMAKDQKSTLDPAKVSGSCGRLKCCLRFEEGLYEELKENLPRRGASVRTAEGNGTVLDYQILSQTVLVDLGDGARHEFHINDVEVEK